MPRMPSFSPDASMVAFVNRANDVDQIFVKHLGHGPAIQLTFDGVPSRRPRWSPDGAALWTVSPAGTGEHKAADLGPMRSIGHYYDVSPRGEIVYVQLKPGTPDLWLSEQR